MVREMRLAAILAKAKAGDSRAMPAPEALKSATQRGAPALGWAKDLGAIEEGYLADCVLFDLDAVHFTPGHDPLADLVYTASGADVEMVMVGGEILMEGRNLLTLDEEKILARCRELARKFR
jgi:5-methylthioadenosine/S-adenosylhomocysteine deaminase